MKAWINANRMFVAALVAWLMVSAGWLIILFTRGSFAAGSPEPRISAGVLTYLSCGVLPVLLLIGVRWGLSRKER